MRQTKLLIDPSCCWNHDRQMVQSVETTNMFEHRQGVENVEFAVFAVKWPGNPAKISNICRRWTSSWLVPVCWPQHEIPVVHFETISIHLLLNSNKNVKLKIVSRIDYYKRSKMLKRLSLSNRKHIHLYQYVHLT